MSTQDEILEQLQRQPAACAEELSQALLKTRANIQYHLKRMEKAGWIELSPAPLSEKDRGRPRHYYALSTRTRANNLLPLLKVLLAQVFPSGLSDDLAQARAQEIAMAILAACALPDQKTFTRRLSQWMKALTTLGYQARWEARASGPIVVFRNCPYYDLLPEHPELCRVDAALLRLALGREVHQQARIQFPKVPACRFVIKNTQG